jgi:hypothetical protein
VSQRRPRYPDCWAIYLREGGRAHSRYLYAQPRQQACLMHDTSTDRLIGHLAMYGYLACDDRAVRFCFSWIRDSVGHIWRVYGIKNVRGSKRMPQEVNKRPE